MAAPPPAFIDTYPVEEDEKKIDHAHIEATDDATSVPLRSMCDDWTPRQTVTRFWKAAMLCVFIGLSAAADGFSVSMTGNIIANTGFIKQYGTVVSSAGVVSLAANHIAIWAALQSCGQIIGMVGLSPISDRFGRKMTLYVLWVFLLGTICAECFGSTWQHWAVAKLLAGISVGSIQATLPLYLAEWSPVPIRGAAVMSYGIWWSIGAFFAPLSLSLFKKTDPDNFKTPLFIQFGLLGVMAIIFVLLPESPWFLVTRGKLEQAHKNLSLVNGGVKGYDVDYELKVMVNTIEQERRIASTFGEQSLFQRYVDCFRGVNKWRTLAAYLPTSCNHLTGLALLGTYSSYFFRQVGFSNAFTISSILFAVKIPTNIFVMLTNDYFGRRSIVLFCVTSCVLTLAGISVLGFVKTNDSTKVVLIVLACFWVAGNNILGSIGWNYCAETGTQRLRASTTGISAALGVVWGLTWNTSIPYMINAPPTGHGWGYKTGLLYVITGSISLVLCYFFVPEIARRNAADLDELFEKGIPARHFKRYVTESQKAAQDLRENV